LDVDNNNNINSKSLRRNIPLAVGGLTALAVFVSAMWLLAFGGYFSDAEIMIFVSIGLGPVALLAVIAGFAVWWLLVFLVSLFGQSIHTHDQGN